MLNNSTFKNLLIGKFKKSIIEQAKKQTSNEVVNIILIMDMNLDVLKLIAVDSENKRIDIDIKNL